jgi:hypothetical protein
MGKVIISTHITLDGVIGPSPRGGRSWREGERYKFDQHLAADAFQSGARSMRASPASM